MTFTLYWDNIPLLLNIPFNIFLGDTVAKQFVARQVQRARVLGVTIVVKYDKQHKLVKALFVVLAPGGLLIPTLQLIQWLEKAIRRAYRRRRLSDKTPDKKVA